MEQNTNQEFKTFSLAIDMVRTIGQPPFEVVWGDTGNLLLVTLTNDGVPIDLADAYVCVVFRSSIGTALQDETNGLALSEETGKFSLQLLPESYGAGDVSADIQVYTGEDRATLITSRRFTFRCRNALLNDKTMQANGTYPPLISATHAATEAAAIALAAAANNGDMQKAVYDPDGDGSVLFANHANNASALGGHGPNHFATAAALMQEAQERTAAIEAITPAAIGAIPIAEKAVADGVATLNSDSKLTAEQACAAVNAQTASYTLALSDAGKLITVESDEACTVTIPADIFPIGTEIEIAQLGAGAVTVAATSGIALLSLDGMVALAGQYAVACLKQIEKNKWLLAGALS